MAQRPHLPRSGRLLAALAIALPACLAVPSTAIADSHTPEEMGLQIALQAQARGEGFGDFTARQTMILRNRQGQESQRDLRMKVHEVGGDGDKTMFVFDQPRDVKGTAFLVHAHPHDADDQWLYLPALKRGKRISSSNRSGSFVGSEFAYEDMTNQDVEKFTYKYLRDEACGNLTCSVTDRVPVGKGSGYSRRVVWQDRDELRIWKVEYYDRKNAHLKTLAISDYQLYLDHCWFAGTMDMVDHLTGKSTALNWSDYEFQTGLDDGDFTQTSLRRAC